MLSTEKNRIRVNSASKKLNKVIVKMMPVSCLTPKVWNSLLQLSMLL